MKYKIVIPEKLEIVLVPKLVCNYCHKPCTEWGDSGDWLITYLHCSYCGKVICPACNDRIQFIPYTCSSCGGIDVCEQCYKEFFSHDPNDPESDFQCAICARKSGWRSPRAPMPKKSYVHPHHEGCDTDG